MSEMIGPYIAGVLTGILLVVGLATLIILASKDDHTNDDYYW